MELLDNPGECFGTCSPIAKPDFLVEGMAPAYGGIAKEITKGIKEGLHGEEEKEETETSKEEEKEDNNEEK